MSTDGAPLGTHQLSRIHCVRGWKKGVLVASQNEVYFSQARAQSQGRLPQTWPRDHVSSFRGREDVPCRAEVD